MGLKKKGSGWKKQYIAKITNFVYFLVFKFKKL